MSEQQGSAVPPFFNRLMSGLLRSPLHGIASRSAMLITFTGHKSGKQYTTPISYLRDGEQVVAFTGGRWWRNLAGGVQVKLYIKRETVWGVATVESEDKQAIADGMQAFLRKVRSDARFYRVSYDDDGEPNRAEVERAAERCAMLTIQLDARRALASATTAGAKP